MLKRYALQVYLFELNVYNFFYTTFLKKIKTANRLLISCHFPKKLIKIDNTDYYFAPFLHHHFEKYCKNG